MDEIIPREEIEQIDAAVTALPFVAYDATGVQFWVTEPTGHDATDIDRGELYARLAIDATKKMGEPMLLAMILRDMVRCGRFGELEAGFLMMVSSAARSGAMN